MYVCREAKPYLHTHNQLAIQWIYFEAEIEVHIFYRIHGHYFIKNCVSINSLYEVLEFKFHIPYIYENLARFKFNAFPILYFVSAALPCSKCFIFVIVFYLDFCRFCCFFFFVCLLHMICKRIVWICLTSVSGLIITAKAYIKGD